MAQTRKRVRSLLKPVAARALERLPPSGRWPKALDRRRCVTGSQSAANHLDVGDPHFVKYRASLDETRTTIERRRRGLRMQYCLAIPELATDAHQCVEHTRARRRFRASIAATAMRPIFATPGTCSRRRPVANGMPKRL